MSKQKLTLVSILAVFALLFAFGVTLASYPDGWTDPPTGSAANQPENWEAWAAENDEIWVCDKIEDPYFEVFGGLAYYTMPAPDAGYMWRLLVVKAGQQDTNTLHWNPVPGERYPSDRDSISHVIRCQMEIPYVPLEVEKTAEGTYDRTVTWELEKLVDPDSHTGEAGEVAGTSTWTVVATKSETLDNYKVTGEITITNPNAIPVEFAISDTLNDDTVAVVTCPGTDDHTGTVTAASGGVDGSITCTYEADTTDDTATKNTAVVTSLTDGVDGATAEKDFNFEENLIGFDEGTLRDPRFDFEEVIDVTTEIDFLETFSCPVADPDLYVDGIHEFTEVNWAFLNGNINLEASAEVDVTCVLPCEWIGETAWAAGPRYTTRGNWATYTPYFADSTVILYAGQTMEAGTVHFSEADDGFVTITIELNEGWRFEDVAENVKIQGYDDAPSGNPNPGSFEYKGDATGDSFEITVPEYNFYGVHVNVEQEVCPAGASYMATSNTAKNSMLTVFLPLTVSAR
jgi:hypothetical protein